MVKEKPAEINRISKKENTVSGAKFGTVSINAR